MATAAGKAGSGGEMGWVSSLFSRAHSSAGERPLHTREVPGSIPGAPIPDRLRSVAVAVAEMGRAGRLCEDSPSVVLATVATRRWGRAIARVAEAAGPPRRRFYLRTQGSGELRRIRLSALARRRCSSPCKGRATAGRPPQHHPWRLEAAAVCGNSRGDEAQRLRRVEPVGIADAVALAVCDERVVGEDDVRSSEQVGAA